MKGSANIRFSRKPHTFEWDVQVFPLKSGKDRILAKTDFIQQCTIQFRALRKEWIKKRKNKIHLIANDMTCYTV